MMRATSTWLLVLLGGALLLCPWRIRSSDAVPPGSISVIFRGGSAESLASSGLLPRLTQSRAAWNGSDLALIPGAAGEELWNRLATGMVRPSSANLFDAYGVPVFGSWQAEPDESADLAHLDQAAAVSRRGGSAVVVLGSTPATSGGRSPVFEAAIDLLESSAARGQYGLLLAIPPQGAPAVGTIWAVGPLLKRIPRFRFREIDLLPTVLYLAGSPIPPIVAGVPAYDMLSGELIFHHPIEYLGGGI